MCTVEEIINRLMYLGININYSEIYNIEYKKTPEYRKDIIKKVRIKIDTYTQKSNESIIKIITDAKTLITEIINSTELKILKASNIDDKITVELEKETIKIKDECETIKLIIEEYFTNAQKNMDKSLDTVGRRIKSIEEKERIDNFDDKIEEIITIYEGQITNIITDLDKNINETIAKVEINKIVKKIEDIIKTPLIPKKKSLRPGGKNKYLKLKKSLLL